MEVERLDPRSGSPKGVKKLDRVDAVQLQTLKIRAGRCVREAIGTCAMKEFGPEAAVSRACAGDVPEYLARIIGDRRASRRFILSMVDYDTPVTVTLPPLKEAK